MEARRRDEKRRTMRGEGDIGDAGATGIKSHHMEGRNNRSGGGNKEIGRQQGREDKRGHGGGTPPSLRRGQGGGKPYSHTSEARFCGILTRNLSSKMCHKMGQNGIWG